MPEYDCLVIGAGIAGLTAAMFTGRYGLSTLVIDQMGAGGQVLNAERIENLPGFPNGLAGYELGPLLQEQAMAAGASFAFDTVTGLQADRSERVVEGEAGEYRAKAVIVAAGSSPRPLGVPGEERLMGRGVSHCATCDGAFFTGQEVCVVGGGDSAADEALVLAGYASKIILYHHGHALDAQKALRDRLAAEPKIEVVFNREVVEVLGDDAVTGVRLRDTKTGAVDQASLAGVFVYVGLEPNTAFLRGTVDLDPAGHVVTNIVMETSLAGVYAAGDIRQRSMSQLATAAGDGATAAIAAYRYVSAPG